MSQTCPYCSADTGGVDPCPKCGGALGVVPEKVQARFVDTRKTFDWQPWALTLFGLLLLCLLVGYRARAKAAQASQNLVASSTGQRAGRIGGSALIDAPLADDNGAPVIPAGPTLAAKTSTDPSANTDQGTTAETLNPPQTQPEQDTADQNQPSLVQIGVAQIATEQDVDGNSFAVGHVTLVNTGPNEITNFSISMTTADGTFALVPFEGTIENPVGITSRRIPPGGYVDVPVMTEGVFRASMPTAQKVVSVSATENGVAVTDSTTIQ